MRVPQSKSSAFQSGTPAESEFAVEDLCEHLALLFGGEYLAVAVRRTAQLNVHQVAVASATHVTDAIVMAAIQSIGDSQNRRQHKYSCLIGLVERGIIKMPFSGRRPAMIARHIGDHVALSFRESSQLRVLDQIKRVLVMRLVCDVITDVV